MAWACLEGPGVEAVWTGTPGRAREAQMVGVHGSQPLCGLSAGRKWLNRRSDSFGDPKTAGQRSAAGS